MERFGVIFDMDGVLVDSIKNIWESFNKLLEPRGIYFSDEEIKEYLGLSLRDQIAIWEKKYNIHLDVEKFSKEAGNMELSLTSNKKANKHLLILLKELKLKNIKMGIGTSSLKWRAEKMLELLKLKDYFSAIVTAEDVNNHKPNPDLFLKVAGKIGVSPENCVVIDDSPSGIEAAKRGKMKVIGFMTNYNKKEELAKADLIINRFSELSYNKLKKLFEK